MVVIRIQRNSYFGQYLGGSQSTSSETAERSFFPSGTWTYSTNANVRMPAFQQIRVRNVTLRVLTHSGNDFFLRVAQIAVMTNIVEITGTGIINSGDLGAAVIAVQGVEYAFSWDNATKGVGTITATINFWGNVSG